MVKKFIGSDLERIFLKIKEDMGPDAKIVSIKEDKLRKRYEIIAQIEKGQFQQKNLLVDEVMSIKRKLDDIVEYIRFVASRNMTGEEKQIPASAEPILKKLISKGFDKNVAISLVRDALHMGALGKDEKSFLFALSGYIKFISFTRFFDTRKVLAFIGPTGAGKTTTIAKVCAHYILSGRRKVALITTDKFRMAAVEQLEKYAKIMNVPFFQAFSEEEATKLNQKLKTVELILIDTMGKSQYDKKNLKIISKIISPFNPEKVLIIPSYIKEEEMINIIKGFSEIGVNYLGFTKLDETSLPGTIINITSTLDIPIILFTTGQRVPDDIILTLEEYYKIIFS